MGRLWLVGGTQESVQLAVEIAQAQLPCTVSVTTEAAMKLYPATPNLTLWVGRLDANQLEAFLLQQQITAVLDASHPFAVEVSQNAIAASLKRKIPYLRYERPTVDAQTSTQRSAGGDSDCCDVQAQSVIQLDFDSLLAGDYLHSSRVLLTVGYRPLAMFRAWQKRSTLFARILPSEIALEAALKAGFTPDRLICLRPPISSDLEAALWRQWEISLVVTKASGAAGGEDIKRTVAAQLGVRLIVITRPVVEYPQQTSNLSVALEFCRQQVL